MSDPNIKAAATNLQRAAQEKQEEQKKLQNDAERIKHNLASEVDKMKSTLRVEETRVTREIPDSLKAAAATRIVTLRRDIDHIESDMKQAAKDLEGAARQKYNEAAELNNLAQEVDRRAQ